MEPEAQAGPGQAEARAVQGPARQAVQAAQGPAAREQAGAAVLVEAAGQEAALNRAKLRTKAR